MNQNKPKRIDANHNQQQRLVTKFSLPCHNEAGFGNLFINGRGFIYLGILKMSFTFLVFTRVHGRASIKAARTANTWLHGHYCKLEATFQNFEFKCLWNQKRCTPKKRYDRFPSVGDHIRAKIYCYKKFLGI